MTGLKSLSLRTLQTPQSLGPFSGERGGVHWTPLCGVEDSFSRDHKSSFLGLFMLSKGPATLCCRGCRRCYRSARVAVKLSGRRSGAVVCYVAFDLASEASVSDVEDILKAKRTKRTPTSSLEARRRACSTLEILDRVSSACVRRDVHRSFGRVPEGGCAVDC
jgi:hypothetical protein